MYTSAEKAARIVSQSTDSRSHLEKLDRVAYCIYQLRVADKHLMQIKTDNLEQMLITETLKGPSLKVLSRI